MSRSLLWATRSQFQYDFQETVHNRDQQTTALESNLAYHLFLYPLQSGAQLQQSSTVSHGGQVQIFPFSHIFPVLLAPASSASGCTLLRHRTCASCHLHTGHSSVGNFWAPSIGVLVCVSETQKSHLISVQLPKLSF